MIVQGTLQNGLTYSTARCPERRTGTESVVLTLTALGVIASVIAFLSYREALKSQLKPDEVWSLNVVKSQSFYIAHAIQIVLLTTAGLVAFFSTDWRKIERGYLWRFGLLLCASLLMTARGYTYSDLLSTKLVDATGPFPFFISMLVFVGAPSRHWNILGKIMVMTAVAFSALAIVGIASLHTFSRQEAVGSLTGVLNILYWPASWLALKNYPRDALARRFRFAPIVIYSLGSIFIQTRLNFVMIFALLAVYAYLQRRQNIAQGGAWVAVVALAVWATLFTAVFLRDTHIFQRIENVTDAFSARLGEDTRTGQLRSFVDSVPPEDLLLGRGSFATWNWNGVAWRGTDFGYLTLLLYGGLPLLLTYIVTHVTPCLTLWRKNSADWQLSAGGVVLLWGIRMFSSSYPSETPEYYYVLFCIGACISRESGPKQRWISDGARTPGAWGS
jgi:hypothetical protein